MEELQERRKILYQILSVLFKRKRMCAIVCTISFILIMFITFLSTPAYKATSKILVRPHPQQQLILFRDLETPGEEVSQINPINNLIQILTSQEMAEDVVRQFELDERLRRKEEEPEELRDAIKGFLYKIITSPIMLARSIGLLEEEERNYFADAVEYLTEYAEDIQLEEDTEVISLSIWEKPPSLSADIANYMTELLIRKSYELDQITAGSAYDFTKEQMQIAEATLRNSENTLLEFKQEEAIINLEEQKKAKLDELHKVEDQYIGVKVELSETQAKLQEMQNQIAQYKRMLSNTTAVADNPIITELKNSLNSLEIELAGNLEKYTESSKTIKSLRGQASESKSKIEEELLMITKDSIASLHSIHRDLPNAYIQLITDVTALRAKKDALEKEVDALRVEAFSLSVMEIELERINRDKAANETLYRNLLNKFYELDVQKASHMSGFDLKIIDKAFLPDDAIADWPKWILIIPLGLLGSILLSFAAVFFIDYWDESFKSPEEIEDRLGLSVLCTVEDVK